MGTTQACLYILSGLPFAGKSTLARRLAPLRGCDLVVYDAINGERGFGLDGAPIPPHEFERTEVEALRRIDAALGRGRSVVYDHGNFLRRRRDELRALAERHCASARLLWVDVPVDLAIARWRHNRDTGGRFDVRDEDFARAVELFEPPEPDEAPLRYDGSVPLDAWLDAHCPPPDERG
jgi:predicted kinase